MNRHVNLSLQIVPIGTKNSYQAIDAGIEVIRNSGILYEVGPFSTTMEGDLNQIWEIVNRAKNASLEAGAEELLLNIQIHMKKDNSVSMTEKTGKFR